MNRKRSQNEFTRVAIAFAVNEVSQFVNGLIVVHFSIVKSILRYLYEFKLLCDIHVTLALSDDVSTISLASNPIFHINSLQIKRLFKKISMFTYIVQRSIWLTFLPSCYHLINNLDSLGRTFNFYSSSI